MEGYFWRFSDRTTGRVVVALCGVNRHSDGDWATVAVATHPGGTVRSAAVDGARAETDRFEVRAGDSFAADAGRVRVRLDGVELDVGIHDPVGWPLRLGAGGLFAALPFLGQYWQPHVLGGTARGSVVVDGDRWDLGGSDVYAEKNWGSGFPDWWWWGQAQGFEQGDVCVAFGGGRLRAGPLATGIGGCVVRLGSRVVRLAPPTAIVRSRVGGGRWSVEGRRPGLRVTIEGHGRGTTPHLLPVPVPAERRNIDTDLEHLAGRIHLTVVERGRTTFDGVSDLAALEVGTTDPDRALRQRRELLGAADPDR
jgi:tocopherol cyclase